MSVLALHSKDMVTGKPVRMTFECHGGELAAQIYVDGCHDPVAVVSCEYLNECVKKGWSLWRMQQHA